MIDMSSIRWVKLAIWACSIGTSATLTAANVGKPDKTLILQEADSGRTFSVIEGTQLSVRLASNPSTGYRWDVVRTDRTFGHPVETFVADDGDQPGTGGFQIFTWRTSGFLPMVGEHEVKMAYHRPWETDTPPIREFSFTLKVLAAQRECVNEAIDPNCQTAKDEGSCRAHGGNWTRIGLSPEPACVCPTPDAGCPCAGAGECAGFCLAGRGPSNRCQVAGATCASHSPMVGCLCLIGRNGQIEFICID